MNRRKDECDNLRTNRMDLAFSGAGFLGSYYFGVIDCWRRYIPKERVNRVAGTSAGSLIAAYYLLDMPLSDCLRKVITMTEDIRKQTFGVFDRSNQIVDLMPVALDETFPDDAHKRVGDRLYVCMTRLKDMKKVIVNKFESKKDLIDALNCSCFIPVWSGSRIPTYKGVKHIDGGFTDCLPAFDEHTIRICCFSGDTDISPYDKIKPKLLSRSVANMPLYFNCANLRRGKKALTPLPAEKILRLLECGFQDTKNFILTNDLIQCDQCFNKTDPRDQPVYSRPSPCITPHTTSPINHRKIAPGEGHYSNHEDNNLSLHPNSTGEQFDRLLHGILASADFASQENFKTSSVEISAAESGGPNDALSKRNSYIREELDNEGEKNRMKGRKVARRNTCPKIAILVEDKFTGSIEPLPSCPPSPNLNRHCIECISMRQEARNDMLEAKVRAEAEKYIAHGRSNKIKNKLTNPLRWLKQIKSRTSYDIDNSTAQVDAF